MAWLSVRGSWRAVSAVFGENSKRELVDLNRFKPYMDGWFLLIYMVDVYLEPIFCIFESRGPTNFPIKRRVMWPFGLQVGKYYQSHRSYRIQKLYTSESKSQEKTVQKFWARKKH